jgi:hypothetical protein
MKTKIDFERLVNEEWNYIKLIYPKAFSEIRDWWFSIDDDGNPYNLWLNSKMYDFFDRMKIFVCPRVDTENEFFVEVWVDGVLLFGERGEDRSDCELHGFLLAIDYLESKL